MSKFNELIKGSTPVAVSFYAEWAPCEEVSEQLKVLKQRMGEDLKLIKIDFDKNETVAQKLNVIGVPSVLVFREGKVLWRASGSIDIEEIVAKLN